VHNNRSSNNRNERSSLNSNSHGALHSLNSSSYSALNSLNSSSVHNSRRSNNNHSGLSSRPNRGSNSEDGYKKAAGKDKLPFSKTGPNTGPPTIALGLSVEAMGDITFLSRLSVSISASSTSSASVRSRLCTWAIHVSSTVGLRS
jgi:hypothetical protein